VHGCRQELPGGGSVAKKGGNRKREVWNEGAEGVRREKVSTRLFSWGANGVVRASRERLKKGEEEGSSNSKTGHRPDSAGGDKQKKADSTKKTQKIS